MSYRTMAWAWEQDGLTPAQKLLLVALADHADEAHSCFPSTSRLAEITGLNRATVMRSLSALDYDEDAPEGERGLGLIRREHRNDANGHRKSNRYHLQVGQSLTMRLRPESHHATPESHVVTPESHGATDIRTTTRTTKGTTTTTNARDGIEDAFDALWNVYPRRAGKATARKAFEKAVKAGTSPTTILDGARRLRDDPNLPEAQYVPHPSTWINREGWEDDPLPARDGGRRPSSFEAGLSMLERVEQRERGELSA